MGPSWFDDLLHSLLSVKLLGGGACIGSFTDIREEPPLMEEPKLTMNIAIIGCGVIAPVHARCLNAIPAVHITWACDIIPEKARGLAGEFDIPRTSEDYLEVLADADLDAVCVCTDHASHVSITVAAIKAGKHVLVEKALAADPDGLEEMFAAHAERPEVIFGAVFQHRFDPEYRYLRQLAREGAFGQILNASVQMRCLRTSDYYQGDKWRGTWAQEGGALLINQAIHFIDILLWIAGPAREVCGRHANLTHGKALEAEDTAAAVLQFESGALGVLEATSSSHLHWDPIVAVHGTKGSVVLGDGVPLKLEFADPDLQGAAEKEFAKIADDQIQIAGKDYYGKGHPAQIADFVDAVRNRRKPFVTAGSARVTVETVLAIYRSQNDHGWVKPRS